MRSCPSDEDLFSQIIKFVHLEASLAVLIHGPVNTKQVRNLSTHLNLWDVLFLNA